MRCPVLCLHLHLHLPLHLLHPPLTSGYGTNLEGPWPLVSRAIEACHERLHELGVPRIATDIRIGTKRPTPDAAPPAGGENARKQASVVHRLAAATATAHDGVPDSTPQEQA